MSRTLSFIPTSNTKPSDRPAPTLSSRVATHGKHTQQFESNSKDGHSVTSTSLFSNTGGPAREWEPLEMSGTLFKQTRS